MKTKKGFTLIEMLVVVLIIGILAAIALPQYMLATEKATATKVLSLGKNVRDAAEAYYLIHGAYPTDPAELDIEYTCPPEFNCQLYDKGYFQAGRINSTTYSYRMTFIYSKYTQTNVPQFSTYCMALATSAKANAVCRNFSGSDNFSSEDGWNRYFI